MSATLQSARLLLRQMQPEDAETIYAYRRLPDVARFQGWEPANVQEIADYARQLQSHPDSLTTLWQQWVFIARQTNEVLGDLAFKLDDNKQQAELGVALAPKHQGQGFATEALKEVIGHLFEQYRLHRIHVSIDPLNHKSIALFERLGFRREGLLKQSLWFKQQWCDDLLMAVLAQEWQA